MHLCDNWFQATTATSDYLNTCDFMPENTPELPDGEGCVGFIFAPGWLEYIGTCLDSPMESGNTFSIGLSVYSSIRNGSLDYIGPNTLGNIEICMYGRSECSDGGMVDITGCPLEDTESDWILLDEVEIDPSTEEWEFIVFDFTLDIDIEELVIGAPCELPETYSKILDYPYFMFDGLTSGGIENTSAINGMFYHDGLESVVMNQDLLDESDEVLYEIGNICSDSISLSTFSEDFDSYQWYYEGVALTDEINTTLDLEVNDNLEGNYQLTVSEDGISYVSKYVIEFPEPAEIELELINPSFPDNSLLFATTELGDEQLLNVDWSIEDENFNGTSIEHEFSSTGVQLVEISAIDSLNCNANLTQEVEIFSDPVPYFTTSELCVNDTVYFYNESLIDEPAVIEEWYWVFGNGLDDEDSETTFTTYNFVDTYYANLTVTADNGCSSTVQLVLDVEDCIINVVENEMPQVEILNGHGTLDVISEKAINSVQIYDLQGRLVIDYNPNSSQYSVSTEKLSSGIYAVIIESENSMMKENVFIR